jgi:hypothetical protein
VLNEKPHDPDNHPVGVRRARRHYGATVPRYEQNMEMRRRKSEAENRSLNWK